MPLTWLWKWNGPPLLERARYEQKANFWHRFMCKPHSLGGQLQDLWFSVWNWGWRGLWFGAVNEKMTVLVVLGVSWHILGCLCICTARRCRQAHESGSSRNICVLVSACLIRPYMIWMPEELLTLSQLATARDSYQRVLSPAVSEEVNIKLARPAAPSFIGGPPPRGIGRPFDRIRRTE